MSWRAHHVSISRFRLAGPGDSLWDFDACETISLPQGQSRAICSCSGLEFVSVLSHRLRPASTLLDALDPEWSEWPRELYEGLQDTSLLAGWLWVCIPLAAYVLMMCGAWVLDQRECYSAMVPHWAVPGQRGFPLWRQLIYVGAPPPLPHGQTRASLMSPSLMSHSPPRSCSPLSVLIMRG